MNSSALYGHISCGILIGAAASLLPVPRRRLAGIAVAAIATFTIAPVLYGLTGAISFTLTQLAVMRLCAFEGLLRKETGAAALLVTLAAIFYPLALGLGPYDPFDLGYRPRLLLWLMAFVGAILAWRDRRVLLVILGLDLLAYALGVFDNLWSALFDPILAGLAAIMLATGSAKSPNRPDSKQAGLTN
jgi:hypothetical protein